jgi:glycerol-3-phosphate dehydrogenase subunit C
MKTLLDWSEYEDAGLGDAYADIPRTGGDFAKAVAVCINSRACESNLPKGVMCPSYRVSGEPDHSTGGRVRRLKAALNGEPGDALFADPALARAMDLCVSCKGCRRECENAVDMARIKIEYLAQRNTRTGLALRTRLFAGLPRWLYRRTWLRELVALRNRLPWLAVLGEKVLGIAARRKLPQPAARPFVPPVAEPPAGEGSREVVLLVDTFVHHFEPEIAGAAVDVLKAAGYRVIVAEPAAGAPEPDRPLCCGRTFLAHGLVEEARLEARRMLAALLPHAEAGRPIIGLEPACLLSLRDEYLALGLGEAAAKVAEKALLFEEFIAREHAAKVLKLPLKSLPVGTPALRVHGHCHQKAVGAMKSLRKVLKLIPGLEFELIESTCCGMAGSFGLEAEHAETSLKMAELSLLPQLRAAPEAPVLANGFSCRHQIEEGCGRRPVHLAVVLREALG